MARIRTIKPEFFVSAQIADVSPTCRLLFVGMWLFCDDAGIHPASPRQLKMEVFPGDDISAGDVRAMMDDLIRVGLIVEYDVTEGMQVETYWQVTGWHHQKIERPRYQYPQPNSTTDRRRVDDISSTPRSPRVRAVPDPTVPETTGDDPTVPETKSRAVARFVPPSVEEVREYAQEAGLSIDPQAFVDFYSSKGWKVGKSAMKDWRASARNADRGGWCAKNGTKSDPLAKYLHKGVQNADARTV